MMKNVFYLIVSAVLLMACKTQPKTGELDYLKNAENVIAEAMNQPPPSIQPGDRFSIYVSAKDMLVASPFNQGYTSSEQVKVEAEKPVYTVDSKGYIMFPVLGAISTTGKNPEELRDEIRQGVSRYVKNPTVNLQLLNFRISVLGEVNRQGEFVLPEGKGTIMNAMALAGDVTMYAKRDEVMVVRNNNGEITKGILNLQDANIIYSPFYELRQGDYIFVPANSNREKLAKQNPNNTLYFAAASTILGALAIILTVVRK